MFILLIYTILYFDGGVHPRYPLYTIYNDYLFCVLYVLYRRSLFKDLKRNELKGPEAE
jgi:hypothetical protein